MGHKGRIRYLFAGANTAGGYKSYLHSILEEMEKIFILKGAPGTGKSTIIKHIGETLIDKGFDIDYIVCALDHKPDGLIVPYLKIAVVDGTYPHSIEPKYPGAIEEIINVSNCWDSDYLEKNKEAIIKATEDCRAEYQKAYKYLRTAKEIHDKWEHYFFEGLDFRAADYKAEKLIEDILKPRRSVIKHYFASSIGPEGPINYIDNITSECKKRYILDGQPGTGKSTLIKKIAQRAVAEGYNVDMYHCSLDPENIDMIVIRELSVAVIHGTEPHRIEPSRPGDVVIDMLECVEQDVVKKYENEVKKTEEEFEITQAQAVKSLKEAYKKFQELTKYYKSAVDFSKVEELEKNIKERIDKFISQKNNTKL